MNNQIQLQGSKLREVFDLSIFLEFRKAAMLATSIQLKQCQSFGELRLTSTTIFLLFWNRLMAIKPDDFQRFQKNSGVTKPENASAIL